MQVYSTSVFPKRVISFSIYAIVPLRNTSHLKWALFLWPWHFRHPRAYFRLGIRSRHEIARWMPPRCSTG